MRAILTISMQGAGKSTYAKYLEQHNPKIKRATKDDLRFMLFDTNDYSAKYEENTRRFGPLLQEMYYHVVSTILDQGLVVIVDETNHTKKERHDMIEFLRATYPGIKIEAHYIMSSLDRCLRRNAKRAPHQVAPEDVIRRYHQELIISLGGSSDPHVAAAELVKEGFDSVYVIDAEKIV